MSFVSQRFAALLSIKTPYPLYWSGGVEEVDERAAQGCHEEHGDGGHGEGLQEEEAIKGGLLIDSRRVSKQQVWVSLF